MGIEGLAVRSRASDDYECDYNHHAHSHSHSHWHHIVHTRAYFRMNPFQQPPQIYPGQGYPQNPQGYQQYPQYPQSYHQPTYQQGYSQTQQFPQIAQQYPQPNILTFSAQQKPSMYAAYFHVILKKYISHH